MKEQNVKIQIYEVVCDEGIITFDDYKKAQDKVKRLYQSELFGYLVRKEFDDKGKIVSEMLIG